jgi:hypothetical protein
VLAKASGADYDTEWVDAASGGGDPLDAWPVGSLFLGAVSTSPATLLGGGTWARYGEGRMLVSQDAGDSDFDTAGETGGEKTVTLVEAQMPAHVHQQRSPTSSSGGQGNFAFDTNSSGDSADQNDTASAGSGQAHNNLPPYIVVYVWQRTA